MQALAVLFVIVALTVAVYGVLHWMPDAWRQRISDFRLRLRGQIFAWFALVGPDVLAFLAWLNSQELSWAGEWGPKVIQASGAIALVFHFFVDKRKVFDGSADQAE